MLLKLRDSMVSIRFKNEKFFKKSLMVLSISLLFVHPLVATTSISITPKKSVDIYYNDILNDLQYSQDRNLIGKDIKIILSELNPRMHQRDNDYTSNGRADQTCQINISLTPEGYVGYIGSQENKNKFYNVVQPQNKMEAEITRKFMVFHEASHCLFSTYNEPILIENNNVLQRNLNYLFKLGSFSYTPLKHDNTKLLKNSSFYQVLNENFADVYAAIIIINQYGAIPDVINMLHRITTQRYEQALVIQRGKTLLPHDTHFGLSEVLEPETINKILENKDSLELNLLALQIANRSTANVLRNNAIEQALNENSLLNGIRNVIADIQLQMKSENNNELFNITNYPFYSNEKNSFIFKTANEIINNEIFYHDYIILSEDKKNKFIRNYINKEQIGKRSLFIDFFNATTKQYQEYVEKNYKRNIISSMNAHVENEDMQDRYDTIKKNLIEKLTFLNLQNESMKILSVNEEVIITNTHND